MDIKKHVEDILIRIGAVDATILEIHKTGSQLFISNSTDLDYVVICSNFKNYYFKSLRKGFLYPNF